MEEKRASGRLKRKHAEEGSWDCSVCTYKNSPEAFKCEMCDVRKGTSTRKPRINPQLVAQQVAQQFTLPPPKKDKKEKNSKDKTHNSGKKLRPPRLKNIDRSSAQHMAVTVGSVTVIITDYKLKERRTSNDSHQNLSSPDLPEPSSQSNNVSDISAELNNDENTTAEDSA